MAEIQGGLESLQKQRDVLLGKPEYEIAIFYRIMDVLGPGEWKFSIPSHFLAQFKLRKESYVRILVIPLSFWGNSENHTTAEVETTPLIFSMSTETTLPNIEKSFLTAADILS